MSYITFDTIKEISEMEAKSEFNLIRQRFWMDVYIAYAGAANAINMKAGAEWADEALKAFDERFNK